MNDADLEKLAEIVVDKVYMADQSSKKEISGLHSEVKTELVGVRGELCDLKRILFDMLKDFGLMKTEIGVMKGEVKNTGDLVTKQNSRIAKLEAIKAARGEKAVEWQSSAMWKILATLGFAVVVILVIIGLLPEEVVDII